MVLETVSVSGCIINIRKSSILSSCETEEAELSTKVHPLPDMFFGQAFLAIAIKDVQISFVATDALRCSRYDLHEEKASPAVFTEGSDGALMRLELMRRCKVRQSAAWSISREHLRVKELESEHDWTFTSSYWGLVHGVSKIETVNGKNSRDDFLPLDKLRDSRGPVRHFHEIHFWEDELADNGFSRMNVRMRIMDSFLYILMKFELRVDEVLESRSIETRVFHEFGSGKILREFKWLENGEDISQFRVFSILRRSVPTGASKHYRIKRVEYPWLKYTRSHAWKCLHSEMIDFFRHRKPDRCSSVSVKARQWPRFASKEQLLKEGFVPGIVWRHGEERRIMFERHEIENIAFDDVGENSHISNLFKARVLNVLIGDDCVERCVVSDASSHVNNRELHFLKLARHVPGKVTTVELPITLTGLLSCPATLQGAHVDLTMPTVKVECVGESIPPPLLLDVSNLRFEPPYSKITLGHIEKLLPRDGKTRLSREYSRRDRLQTEVVLCYETKGIEERPLPTDYQDPNFFNRQGRKYHVTYSGFWPRQ